MIIISAPLAITFAASEGGKFSFFFAGVLAIGIDIYTDSKIVRKN